MLALLRWLIGFGFAACVLTFAVLNRDSVTLTYTPIHDPLEIPIYALGLGLLAIGYLFGALTIWVSDSKLRRERRKQKREIKQLHKELDTHHNPQPHSKIFKDAELEKLLPALPDKTKA